MEKTADEEGPWELWGSIAKHSMPATDLNMHDWTYIRMKMSTNEENCHGEYSQP